MRQEIHRLVFHTGLDGRQWNIALGGYGQNQTIGSVMCIDLRPPSSAKSILKPDTIAILWQELLKASSQK